MANWTLSPPVAAHSTDDGAFLGYRLMVDEPRVATIEQLVEKVGSAFRLVTKDPDFGFHVGDVPLQQVS